MEISEHNEYVWNDNDTRTFIEFGNAFIPDRARQISRICDLLPMLDTKVIIADVCCGEGMLSRAIAKKADNYELYCLDGSEQMLAKAKENMKGYESRAHFQGFDFDHFESSNFPDGCHAIVSSLALHHINDQRKRDFIAFSYDRLVDGGVLVIADLVRPTTKKAMQIAADDWGISVYERSWEFQGTLEPYHVFCDTHWNMYQYPNDDPGDMPSTLYDQLKWMENSGFIKIDVVWMYGGHAIYYGYKSKLTLESEARQ